MSFTKLKAALHNQIARWTLLLTLLTTIQTCWYLFAEKMPVWAYTAGMMMLAVGVQLINIVYGKKIAAYKSAYSNSKSSEIVLKEATELCNRYADYIKALQSKKDNRKVISFADLNMLKNIAKILITTYNENKEMLKECI